MQTGRGGGACDLVQLHRGLSFDEFSLGPLCSGTASRATRSSSSTGERPSTTCNRIVVDAGAQPRLTPRAAHPGQRDYSLFGYSASRGLDFEQLVCARTALLRVLRMCTVSVVSLVVHVSKRNGLNVKTATRACLVSHTGAECDTVKPGAIRGPARLPQFYPGSIRG